MARADVQFVLQCRRNEYMKFGTKIFHRKKNFFLIISRAICLHNLNELDDLFYKKRFFVLLIVDFNKIIRIYSNT